MRPVGDPHVHQTVNHCGDNPALRMGYWDPLRGQGTKEGPTPLGGVREASKMRWEQLSQSVSALALGPIILCGGLSTPLASTR